MSRVIVNLLITLISIAITFAFAHFIFFLVFKNFVEITMNSFQKYLITQRTPIDLILVQSYPLLFIYPIIRFKLNFRKEMLLMTIVGVCTISLSLIAGMILSVFTWKNSESNYILTDYILEQPFANYWTIFVVIGISIPVSIVLFKNRKISKKGINTLD